RYRMALAMYEGLKLDLGDHFRLVDIHAAAKQFGAARKELSWIRATSPKDPRLPLKAAELALWHHGYDDALQQYQQLLDRNVDHPALWSGFIDAAASAKEVSRHQRKAVLHIYDRTRSSEDVVFLGRLAWVLRRVEEMDRSVALLRRVVALAPQDQLARL